MFAAEWRVTLAAAVVVALLMIAFTWKGDQEKDDVAFRIAEPERLHTVDSWATWKFDQIAHPKKLSSASKNTEDGLVCSPVAISESAAERGDFSVELCVATDNCFRGALRISRDDCPNALRESQYGPISNDSDMDAYLRSNFGPQAISAHLEGPEFYSLRPSFSSVRKILGDKLVEELFGWPWSTSLGPDNYLHPIFDGNSTWEDPKECKTELHFHLLISGPFQLKAAVQNLGFDSVADYDRLNPEYLNISLIENQRIDICPHLPRNSYNPHLVPPPNPPDCSQVQGPVDGTWLHLNDDDSVPKIYCRDAVFVPYACAYSHLALAKDPSGRTHKHCDGFCTDVPAPENPAYGNSQSKQYGLTILFEGDSQLRSLHEGFKNRLNPEGRGFQANPVLRQYRFDYTQQLNSIRVDFWMDDMLSRFENASERLVNDTLGIPYKKRLPEKDEFDRYWSSFTLVDYVVLGIGHWPAASLEHHGHWSHAKYLHKIVRTVRLARRAAEIRNTWAQDPNRRKSEELDRQLPLHFIWSNVQPISPKGVKRLVLTNDWRTRDRLWLWHLWTLFIVYTGGQIPPGIKESSLLNHGPLPPFDAKPHDHRNLMLLNSHMRFQARLDKAPDAIHFSGVELESLADEVISKVALCSHRKALREVEQNCRANTTASEDPEMEILGTAEADPEGMLQQTRKAQEDIGDQVIERVKTLMEGNNA